MEQVFPPPVMREEERAPRLLLALVACAGLLVISAMAYSTWLEHQVQQVFVPFARTAGQIQLHAAVAHLWAEEVVEGDPHIMVESVWGHMRETTSALLALEAYEERLHSDLIPIHEPELHKLIPQMKQHLARFTAITEKRLGNPKASRIGTAIDDEHDAVFAKILEEASQIDAKILDLSSRNLAMFDAIQVGLTIGSIILAIAAGLMVLRHYRSREEVLAALNATNQQLQATEQQLRASNQQLMASEQQLRASNQQLQATEQQLLASNQQLRTSEQRYRGLFETMSEGMAIHRVRYDSAGQPVNYEIVDVNGQYEQILGMAKAKVVNRLATDIYGTTEPPYLAEYSGVAATGIPCRFEVYFPPMDRHFLINVFSPERGSFATVFSDITALKERDRVEARIQKLESVGVLAGGIAHDFNNLLTAILANVTLGRVKMQAGDAIEARLIEIEKAVERAKELTNQLLTFAKGGKPVRKLTNLEPVIRDSATLATRGSNVHCEIRFAPGVCNADVDAGQIGQVINNLVLNAVHAMPSGGTVQIDAQVVAVGPGTAMPLDPGQYVCISVADHGPGIAPEHMDRIFDPYFTTKEKGSGLGLAVSLSVVKNHQGHIAVESRAGDGATFLVYLPASREVATAEPGADSGMGLLGSGRVLVMDDEEMIREVCVVLLQNLGYEVESVVDGREAVERYAVRLKEGRPFDAVILDLTVPGGMGGKETVRELLALHPGARVLVSSGYSNDPVMSDFTKHGFRGLIPKPYSVQSLSIALAEVLKQ